MNKTDGQSASLRCSTMTTNEKQPASSECQSAGFATFDEWGGGVLQNNDLPKSGRIPCDECGNVKIRSSKPPQCRYRDLPSSKVGEHGEVSYRANYENRK